MKGGMMKNLWKVAGIFILVLVILTVVGWGLGFGDVIMRRVIFENSFQYQQARDLEAATYEAQLEEIRVKLGRTDLDASTRANLEAQESSIRVLLKASRERAK